MVRYFSSCPAVQSAADPCSICLESQGTAPGQAESISDTISAAFISLLSDPCLPLSPSTPPHSPLITYLHCIHLAGWRGHRPAHVSWTGAPSLPATFHPRSSASSLLPFPHLDCVALTSAPACSSRHPFSAPHRPTPTPLSRPMLPASLW